MKIQLQPTFDFVSNILSWYTILFVIIELAIIYFSYKQLHTKETKVSLLSGSIAVITQGAVKKYVMLGAMIYLYQYRIFDFSITWYSCIYAFFICTLLQFTTHYMYHKIRVLWCFHVVHHNALYLNSATSMRNSVLDIFSIDFIYFLVPLLGVQPLVYFIIYSLTKFWGIYIHIHEDMAIKMPKLEKYIVSPALHQIHHASNALYIDKNFGEVIPWYDMLLGTFVQHSEKPIYGTVSVQHVQSFWESHTYEFKALWRDVKSTNSWSEKLGFIFRVPGWVPKAI